MRRWLKGRKSYFLSSLLLHIREFWALLPFPPKEGGKYIYPLLVPNHIPGRKVFAIGLIQN